MTRFRYWQRSIAGLMLVAFSFLSLMAAPAKAAMVGTPDVLQSQSSELSRQKVKSFLERQEVIQQMHTWGVSPDEAQARVDSMTDAEVALMAEKIDQMPAGGDALGFVLLVGVIAFLTLVITDIMGVTDVFTFIKKR